MKRLDHRHYRRVRSDLRRPGAGAVARRPGRGNARDHHTPRRSGRSRTRRTTARARYGNWPTECTAPRDDGAAVSSGSFVTAGMLVAPCSIKTLSGIAQSYNDTLVVRAADVCLKERRRVVLLLRETPLHAGHIELMAQATRNGAVIMPPVPAFYTQPETLDDVVNQTVARALELLDVALPGIKDEPGTEMV